MTYRTDLRTLDDLASDLPFHIDESDRVNEVFIRYASSRTRHDRRLLDLWTYCYVRRYFLVKFIREAAFRTSELEQVVERTYRKVERNRMSIDRTDRYAQWVSVVCRNTYYNFVTRRNPTLPLEMVDEPVVPPDEPDLDIETGALHVALSRAIDALPPFLQPTVRMRFVENLSYEEISRITGKRVPTVRSYIHKACRRFRSNPELKHWADLFLK